MKKSIQSLYLQVRDVHKTLITMSDYLISEASKGDVKDLADTAYAMREIASFADEIRKKANKIGEQSQKVACFVAVQAAGLNDDPTQLKITTDYCTAMPDVKRIASLPDKRNNPKEYAELMQHYGVSPEHFESTSGNPFVVCYWPGVIDRINKDMALGKPTPPGIDPTKMIPEYRLNIRGAKGVGDE